MEAGRPGRILESSAIRVNELNKEMCKSKYESKLNVRWERIIEEMIEDWRRFKKRY